jgi:hypothetical protein
MVRHDRCRAGRPRTTGASRRQAPDRLTRTSGDFVIVEVRLRANTPEVLARPSGLPSPVPDPAQPRWESADHRTTQRRRPRRPPERRRSTAGSRSSLCLASSTSAVMRLRASHRSYSCRVFRRTTAAHPDLAVLLPHGTTNPTHTNGIHGPSRADCGRESVGEVWDDRRPDSGDAQCSQSAG